MILCGGAIMSDVPAAPRKKRKWAWLIVAVVIAAVLVCAAIPTVRRNRKLRNRLICSSNMKAIGTQFEVYVWNNLAFPRDPIQALVEMGYITPAQARCPVGGGRYTFVDRGVSSAAAEDVDFHARDVIVYEPLSNHNGEGANVLFGDGHSEFVTPDEFRRLIRDANDRSTSAP